MPDFAITLTDAQVKVVRRLDANLTARQVVQAHLDTWLAPLVAEAEEAERLSIMDRYRAASPQVREQVRALLGA
jgi:hypothetical protein